MVYPIATAQEQVIVIAAMAGVLGAGALSFYTIPKALLIWLSVITTGCTLALLLEGSSVSYGAILLLLVYSLALYKAGLTIGKIFVQAHMTRFEVTQQADTIGILLKEYSENLSDWLWELSPTGVIIRGKHEFEKALNVKSVSLISVNFETACSEFEKANQASLQTLREAFFERRSVRDIEIRSNVGERCYWVSVSGKPINDERGRYIGFRGVASNITERKLHEEQIAHLAHHDVLTGLVNRATFTCELVRKFEQDGEPTTWSILYLDLDGFKSINDHVGHKAGDFLLTSVASRLINLVGKEDIVARIGGDEFAIISNSATDAPSVSALSESLIAEISRPYNFDGKNLIIGVSIGVAIGPRDGEDANTILHNADLALYRSKAEGKGTYRLYEVEMDKAAKEQRNLERDLQQAVPDDQLSVQYQPIVSADNQQITGFEALARWTHPDRGVVPPSTFIPLAERLGIIAELERKVLRDACVAATRWPKAITVAVNLSAQQFQSQKIIAMVVNALTESGLEPERLEIEITERLFLGNTEEVMYILRELKSMGVNIVMDDFGTGYSSLSYIMNFPFDKLKIDRSFISSLGDNATARNILEVIGDLGDVLDLNVTAEGIETSEQLQLMDEIKCTHYQGYYFGQPQTEQELMPSLLRNISGIINDEENSIDQKPESPSKSGVIAA
ncbi:MAG: EAL domain-containing protein [Pseudomonadota bacterium]